MQVQIPQLSKERGSGVKPRENQGDDQRLQAVAGGVAGAQEGRSHREQKEQGDCSLDSY